MFFDLKYSFLGAYKWHSYISCHLQFWYPMSTMLVQVFAALLFSSLLSSTPSRKQRMTQVLGPLPCLSNPDGVASFWLQVWLSHSHLWGEPALPAPHLSLCFSLLHFYLFLPLFTSLPLYLPPSLSACPWCYVFEINEGIFLKYFVFIFPCYSFSATDA